MVTLEMVLEELNQYPSEMLTRFTGASVQAISDLEKKISRPLPENYKRFLQACNGFRIGYSGAILGIHGDNESLDVYDNYRWETESAAHPLNPDLLPVSPNGLGDFYCLNLQQLSTSGEDCPVIFWKHDGRGQKHWPVAAPGFVEFVWQSLQQLRVKITA